VAKVITNSGQKRLLIVKKKAIAKCFGQNQDIFRLVTITANKAPIQTIVYSLKKALLESKSVAATAF